MDREPNNDLLNLSTRRSNYDYLKNAVVKLDSLLEDPQAKNKITELTSLLGIHLNDIYGQLDESTEVVFLVGGKSRNVAEEFLRAVSDSLLLRAQQDIHKRIRLNSEENEALYAKMDLGFNYTVPKELEARLADASKHYHIILIEDYMSSGRKVYRFLDALSGIPNTTSEVIALSGEKQAWVPDHLDYRPYGWWDRVKDVYIPLERDELLAGILSNLATTQSHRVKLRLAGQSSEDERQVLQHATERIRRFHNLLQTNQR